MPKVYEKNRYGICNVNGASEQAEMWNLFNCLTYTSTALSPIAITDIYVQVKDFLLCFWFITRKDRMLHVNITGNIEINQYLLITIPILNHLFLCIFSSKLNELFSCKVLVQFAHCSPVDVSSFTTISPDAVMVDVVKYSIHMFTNQTMIYSLYPRCLIMS